MNYSISKLLENKVTLKECFMNSTLPCDFFLLDRNIVPDNIVTTTFRKVVTQRKPDTVTGILTRVVETTERSNILGKNIKGLTYYKYMTVCHLLH